jgi:hypothetical protein
MMQRLADKPGKKKWCCVQSCENGGAIVRYSTLQKKEGNIQPSSLLTDMGTWTVVPYAF